MNTIMLVIYVIVGWQFGKWNHFKEYYPTLLFFITGDLLYQFLFQDYKMWRFHPVGPIDAFLHLNSTFIVLLNMAVQYTVTVAVLLGNATFTVRGVCKTVILWSMIYGLTEFIAQSYGALTYHHGWSYFWDLAFNMMMFSMLLLHHKSPFLAWALVLPISVTFWQILDVPFSILK